MLIADLFVPVMQGIGLCDGEQVWSGARADEVGHEFSNSIIDLDDAQACFGRRVDIN